MDQDLLKLVETANLAGPTAIPVLFLQLAKNAMLDTSSKEINAYLIALVELTTSMENVTHALIDVLLAMQTNAYNVIKVLTSITVSVLTSVPQEPTFQLTLANLVDLTVSIVKLPQLAQSVETISSYLTENVSLTVKLELFKLMDHVPHAEPTVMSATNLMLKNVLLVLPEMSSTKDSAFLNVL